MTTIFRFPPRLLAQVLVVVLLACSIAGCSDGDSSGSDISSSPMNDGNPSTTTIPGSETAPVPAGFIPDISQITGDPPLNVDVADVPGSGFYTSHTASAIVNGPVLGTGEYDNNEAVRSIPFQIGEQQSGLLLEQVYATRDEAFSFTNVGVILVVRNLSDSLVCSVGIDSPQLINREKQFVRMEYVDFAYAAGSAWTRRINDEAFTASTCLPGGERAYITARFDDIDLQDILGISIAELSGSFETQDATAESQAVVPLQYDIEFDGDLMNITLQNQSAESVNVTGGHHVFLDEAGFAVFATYSALLRGINATPDGIFEPGETRTEAVIVAGFQGQASTVRSVFSIEPVE